MQLVRERLKARVTGDRENELWARLGEEFQPLVTDVAIDLRRRLELQPHKTRAGGELFLAQNGDILYYWVADDRSSIEAGAIFSDQAPRQVFERFQETIARILGQTRWSPLSSVAERYDLIVEESEPFRLTGDDMDSARALSRPLNRKVLLDSSRRTVTLEAIAGGRPLAEFEPAVEELESQHLVNREFQVFCRDTGIQLVKFSSKAALEEAAAMGFRSFSSGRPIAEERIVQFITATEAGRNLARRNLWLALVLGDSLRSLGLEGRNLRWAYERDYRTVNLFASLPSAVLMFEIQEDAVTADQAFRFLARSAYYRPDAAFLVCPVPLAGDSRQVLARARSHESGCLINVLRDLGELESELDKVLRSSSRRGVADLLGRFEQLTRVSVGAVVGEHLLGPEPAQAESAASEEWIPEPVEEEAVASPSAPPPAPAPEFAELEDDDDVFGDLLASDEPPAPTVPRVAPVVEAEDDIMAYLGDSTGDEVELDLEPAPVVSRAPESPVDEENEFDLDLDLDTELVAARPEPEPTPVSSAVPSLDDFDELDALLADTDSSSSRVSEYVSEPEPEPEPVEPPVPTDLEMDAELDELLNSELTRTPGELPAEELDLNADFLLDEEPAGSGAPPAVEPEPGPTAMGDDLDLDLNLEDFDLDLKDFDLDLDLPNISSAIEDLPSEMLPDSNFLVEKSPDERLDQLVRRILEEAERKGPGDLDELLSEVREIEGCSAQIGTHEGLIYGGKLRSDANPQLTAALQVDCWESFRRSLEEAQLGRITALQIEGGNGRLQVIPLLSELWLTVHEVRKGLESDEVASLPAEVTLREAILKKVLEDLGQVEQIQGNLVTSRDGLPIDSQVEEDLNLEEMGIMLTQAMADCERSVQKLGLTPARQFLVRTEERIYSLIPLDAETVLITLLRANAPRDVWQSRLQGAATMLASVFQ